MGRLKGSKNIVELSESGRPFTSKIPLEERLKTIANLIVDRIIEEQRNGTLHMKSQSVKDEI